MFTAILLATLIAGPEADPTVAPSVPAWKLDPTEAIKTWDGVLLPERLALESAERHAACDRYPEKCQANIDALLARHKLEKELWQREAHAAIAEAKLEASQPWWHQWILPGIVGTFAVGLITGIVIANHPWPISHI